MFTAETIAREIPNLFDCAFPRAAHEPIKAWLYRIASATGLSPSYTKRLRYGEVGRVPAHVYALLHHAAERQKAARRRADAQRHEVQSLLAAMRAGGAVGGTASAGLVGLDDPAGEAAGQMTLPFGGFRR